MGGETDEHAQPVTQATCHTLARLQLSEKVSADRHQLVVSIQAELKGIKTLSAADVVRLQRTTARVDVRLIFNIVTEIQPCHKIGLRDD